MIHIETVRPEQKQALYNYLQKYLYELSAFYGDEMNADGDYEYRYFPCYFEEASRKALFLYRDDTVIGFSLINDHSYTDEPVDHCLAEFTVFPAYRRKGYAMEAFERLLQSQPGNWQLKYSSENPAAQAFWHRIRDRYQGAETPLGGTETVLSICRLPAASESSADRNRIYGVLEP